MKFLAVFVAVLAVAAAAPRFSAWDVNELSAAISDPNTDPALIPYLTQALNSLMEALWSGSPITTVPVATPGGMLPSPSQPTPIIPVAPGGAAEVAPIAPAPAVAPEAASAGPLVQIIVNVNADPQTVGANPEAIAAPPTTPIGVYEPVVETPVTPVIVVDQPAVVSPVIVVDQPAVVSPVIVVDQPTVVSPVIVVDQPAVVEPVIVVDQPAVVDPIIVVDQPTLPEIVGPINPVDVIAVAAPEVNPVDIISPVPAVAGGENSGILV